MGGMAELFLAEVAGAHGFAKTVVIKRILPHLAPDEQFTSMFIAEAKITAQLAHPKIAQTFELGKSNPWTYQHAWAKGYRIGVLGSTDNHYGQPGNKSSGKGNQYDAANAVLGFSIQSNLIKTAKRSDRGLRRARFAVLKNAPCPSALVECGFLSNPEEEALMIDASYREAAARGISNGIIGYITLVNRARK